jgi:hypothetical protein
MHKFKEDIKNFIKYYEIVCKEWIVKEFFSSTHDMTTKFLFL